MTMYIVKVVRTVEQWEDCSITLCADDEQEAIHKAEAEIRAVGRHYFTLQSPEATDTYEVIGGDE